ELAGAAGAVRVRLHGARRLVRHGQRVLDVGERCVEEPEVSTEGGRARRIDHLDHDLGKARVPGEVGEAEVTRRVTDPIRDADGDRSVPGIGRLKCDSKSTVQQGKYRTRT